MTKNQAKLLLLEIKSFIRIAKENIDILLEANAQYKSIIEQNNKFIKDFEESVGDYEDRKHELQIVTQGEVSV